MTTLIPQNRRTLGTWTALAAALLAGVCQAASPIAPEAGPTRSGNPIFPGWYADPEGIVIDRQFWVYPTDGNHRVVCIDHMEFDDQGMIRPVKITFERVEPAPL